MSVKKVSRKVPKTQEKFSLTDNDLEDLVNSLWENFDDIPTHVQDLLQEATKPGTAGTISYAIAAGWAAGKFDYVPPDPWTGTPGGWISISGSTN